MGVCQKQFYRQWIRAGAKDTEQKDLKGKAEE